MSVPKGYKYGKRKKPEPFTQDHKSRISKNSAKYWLGKKHTKEMKEKNRQAKLKNPTRYWLGKKGIHMAPKTEFKKGHKPWNWKGGISPEYSRIRSSVENKLWRDSVFSRDNWTCQKYMIKGCKLNPHHILNFSSNPELRFAIDNGITLSEKAHKEFHKIYGKKNNTRKQLLEFLSKK